MRWTSETTADTTATPAEVFAAYVDVANWPLWDHGLDEVRLDGAFSVGSRGTLRPKGAPTFRYELTSVSPNRGFSDRTPMPHPLLPLAVVHVAHELVPLPSGGTRITHRVGFSGLLGRLAARLMGPGFAKDMPDAVLALAEYAPDRSGEQASTSMVGGAHATESRQFSNAR